MVSLRVMTEADLPLGMALKREAGWNQTEADWRRFLALEPTGCFVAEDDGEACGTATTCVFGSVAWIAMVLVAESRRGKGIGTALMRHALEYLDGRGVPSVRLDATPAGRPLYERLGFVAEYEVVRWGGTPRIEIGEARAQPYHEDWLEPIAELDAEATGADRTRLLAALGREFPETSYFTTNRGEVTAFLTARPGERAWQIGPCVANRERDARALLTLALAIRAGEPVIVDVPRDHEAATAIVQAAGLAELRGFTRMCRGEPVIDHPEMIWASSGAEKG